MPSSPRRLEPAQAWEGAAGCCCLKPMLMPRRVQVASPRRLKALRPLRALARPLPLRCQVSCTLTTPQEHPPHQQHAASPRASLAGAKWGALHQQHAASPHATLAGAKWRAAMLPTSSLSTRAWSKLLVLMLLRRRRVWLVSVRCCRRLARRSVHGVCGVGGGVVSAGRATVGLVGGCCDGGGCGRCCPCSCHGGCPRSRCQWPRPRHR